jgi:cyclic pyranopterin monophosphate synthase
MSEGRRLTHLDEAGRPRMVDVGDKPETRRAATARGEILMRRETLLAITGGQIEKGDVLAVAQVAAIMAAKRTWEIIPMCHPLLLSGVDVAFQVDDRRSDTEGAIEIEATVRTVGKTGAEMEALTAVSVAAPTIYDMCKAIDPAMHVERVRLTRKSGGKSGDVSLE